ncbi:MAG: 3alpha(or 20beta)-hydroxysteroid dehydrogenase [Sulfitobacter sp.]|jgi:3alpha(or 20beta)-hydroxysteroid dehydrogenase
MRLKDKVVVITGGAGELGSTMAARFLAEGASVLLADLSMEALQAASDSLEGERIALCVADVGEEADNERIILEAEAAFGGVDVFVANAGIEGKMGPIAAQQIEDFDLVMRVNVRGPFLGAKYALPAIARRGGGSIIILSSIAGVSGSTGAAPYSISKHAVIGLMRCAALEGAPDGVRVNTINPAPLVGRMIRSIEEGLSPGNADDIRAAIIDSSIPMGRYGEFDDMLGLLVLLASDESSFLTGSVYMADGGMSAR